MSASPVAILTGCASGIGLATTQLFLSNGYRVLGVDINDMDLGKIDEESQPNFAFYKTNLATGGECDVVVKECVARFGERIDFLGNIAGVMDGFASADVYTDDEFERVMTINLTVPTRLIRAVLPAMKAQKKGSIVNVSSKAGLSGAAAGLAYTASKHALLGVTKQTAFRFRNEGIRCNAVMPGAVATNISNSFDQKMFDQDTIQQLMPLINIHIPQGEMAEIVPKIAPLDVANAIFFLAGDQSGFINGACVPIDNAWSTT
ncbi:short-chain dehydrogenase/reductase SDR [Phlyctema vagabunda]|uniref:Short-chain dehydrogenase/reductase SDR n=1 Tax=Phlyctema vagabunda TaxID=108571 RepID=A0ABR4PIN9_9HELO